MGKQNEMSGGRGIHGLLWSPTDFKSWFDLWPETNDVTSLFIGCLLRQFTFRSPGKGKKKKRNSKHFDTSINAKTSVASVPSKSNAVYIPYKLLYQPLLCSVVAVLVSGRSWSSELSWVSFCLVVFFFLCICFSFICVFVFCCCFCCCCFTVWPNPAMYPGWPQTHFRTQIGLELKNLFAQLPKCWALSIESGCVSLLVHRYDHELEVNLNFNG